MNTIQVKILKKIKQDLNVEFQIQESLGKIFLPIQAEKIFYNNFDFKPEFKTLIENDNLISGFDFYIRGRVTKNSNLDIVFYI